MIDEEVRRIAEEFANRWSLASEIAPILLLDGTWPSIGVLDPLTAHLRQTENFSPSDGQLIKGAAAYLAQLAHDSWRAFHAEVHVGLGEQGIFIKASAGPLITPGQEFVVSVENSLKTLLRKPPLPFPVVGDFEREVLADYQLISLFGVGLCTGRSPFGEGAWALADDSVFKDNTEFVVRHLAVSSARHYSRLYHAEPLGQVEELYLRDLIYPPTMMNEKFPGELAIEGCFKFFEEFQISKRDALRMAHNFALSPDERFSTVGLALYAGLVESEPSAQIIATADRRGTFMGLLRPAMLLARERAGFRADWSTQDNFDTIDLLRIHIEQVLGLIPWVKLSPRRFRDKKLRPLIDALINFDFAEALSLNDKLVSEFPGDLDIRVQRVYLSIISGRLEEALKELPKLLSEYGAENEPMIFYLWGLCELGMERIPEAKVRFEHAFKLPAVDYAVRYEAANNYAWCLMLLEQYDEALAVTGEVIPIAPAPVTMLLNEAFILRTLNRFAEAEERKRRLLELAPLDSRVVHNLMLERELQQP